MQGSMGAEADPGAALAFQLVSRACSFRDLLRQRISGSRHRICNTPGAAQKLQWVTVSTEARYCRNMTQVATVLLEPDEVRSMNEQIARLAPGEP
jgi:hypothetical protein